jgi:hypothetical protein
MARIQTLTHTRMSELDPTRLPRVTVITETVSTTELMQASSFFLIGRCSDFPM